MACDSLFGIRFPSLILTLVTKYVITLEKLEEKGINPNLEIHMYI